MQVYLGIGTNLGEKENNLHSAIAFLQQRVGQLLRCSSFYYSKPWGFRSDNDFVNVVASFETDLSPLDLLEQTQAIERDMGRPEKSQDDQYVDRIIDIDILLYGEEHINLPQLKIPHPLMQERDFVMIPLREIMADDSSSAFISPKAAEWNESWTDLSVLSSHSSSVLYRAKRFGRWCVLKALPKACSTDEILKARLRKEFSLGVQLEHPHIVRTIDYTNLPELGDCLVLEWIDGPTLGEFLQTNPSSEVRKKLLSQLLDALNYLHQHQIIHRDIKPANILVTRNGQNIKLIDFGLSDSDDYAALKTPSGTLSFISPEQLLGLPIDARADIYSVGKLMHLLCPLSYRHIARKCMSENREKRYASVSAIQRAILSTDRFRRWWPLALGSIMLLLSLCLSLYIYFRPDPREQMLKMAQTHASELYQQLCERPVPSDLWEYNDYLSSYFVRCQQVSDSLTSTISDELLRIDFQTQFTIFVGQYAQQYADTYNHKD